MDGVVEKHKCWNPNTSVSPIKTAHIPHKKKNKMHRPRPDSHVDKSMCWNPNIVIADQEMSLPLSVEAQLASPEALMLHAASGPNQFM